MQHPQYPTESAMVSSDRNYNNSQYYDNLYDPTKYPLNEYSYSNPALSAYNYNYRPYFPSNSYENITSPSPYNMHWSPLLPPPPPPPTVGEHQNLIYDDKLNQWYNK